MCILVAVRGAAALWVAANRDELHQRPWEGPQLLVDEPPVFGGKDLVGGGSWLAVNVEAAFIVGVTNARRGALRGGRSRGNLVVNLAAEESLPAAVALLTELDLTSYGSFNLLLADPAVSWVASNHPAPRLEQVAEDVVAIGNDPLDLPSVRVEAAALRVRQVLDRGGDPATALAEVLADHEGDDPLCRHGQHFGTVCSTILAVGRSSEGQYLFAAGPPCTTEFLPVALPLPPTN